MAEGGERVWRDGQLSNGEPKRRRNASLGLAQRWHVAGLGKGTPAGNHHADGGQAAELVVVFEQEHAVAGLREHVCTREAAETAADEVPDAATDSGRAGVVVPVGAGETVML